MRVRLLLAAFAIALSALACAGPASRLTQAELVERIEAGSPGLVVLDVRTPQEFAEGHVPGAVNIPHDELASRLGELKGAKDRDVVVYCRSGRRAGIALEVLEKAGFRRTYHLEGDYLGWSAAGRAVEKPGP